ncbi:hypothetical protein QCA50_003057 [Cerrena zonata]|uniref:F-box domain-containing protein n=1 Tax=Cerrena zonata TaxID=2478898 RepID=A0AAW0GVF2_9APHY
MPNRNTPLSSSTSTPQSRQVNTLLHSLRGEHYRHERNVRGAQARVLRTLSGEVPNRSTIPISQLFGTLNLKDNSPASSDETTRYTVKGSQNKHASDPSSTDTEENEKNTPEWRDKVLSVLFKQSPLREDDLANGSDSENDTPRLPDQNRQKPQGSASPRVGVPSLVELCLEVLLDYCRGRYFAEILVPCLPPHLRRVLLRWTAVHSPLPTTKLFALCEPEGHVNGELIVVGPQASLPSDFFSTDEQRDDEQADGEIENDDNDTLIPETESDEESWESTGSGDSELSLHTLALVTTPLPANMLFSLPPTITHLALLALPAPVPIHRLPRICPLLEVLDLSYNLWLSYVQVVSSEESGRFVSVQGDGKGGERMIERVEWSRWTRLRVLGLRECNVGENVVAKVNRGRWTDVQIIGPGEPILR